MKQAAPAATGRRDDAFGALRLVLAAAVLAAHIPEYGFSRGPIGAGLALGQTDLGVLAVIGFFAISGYLITASALRLGVLRFAWHRFLRIMPGLWVSLAVTALVAAPLVYRRERGTLAGFWAGPDSPIGYLTANITGALRQPGIDGLLAGNPWGRRSGLREFNGALWSIAPEIACYGVVAVLAVAGVLCRARAVVPILAVGGLAAIALHPRLLHGPMTSAQIAASHALPPLPRHDTRIIAIVVTVFLLGATACLYQERLTYRDRYGVAAALVLLATLRLGGFATVGVTALTYLLLWGARRMPGRARRIGRDDDYSYGIYIYGTLVQQVLSSYGLYRWGVAGYLAAVSVLTLALAILSWKLVEKPALNRKEWTPRRAQPNTGCPTSSHATHSAVDEVWSALR